MPDDASGLVKRIRRFTKLPVAVGFGISTPEQFAAVGKFAEGAVVGSAIVQLIEQNPGREAAAVAEFIRQLSALGSQLSAKQQLRILVGHARWHGVALRFATES